MADKVNISDIEALDRFRAQLLVFIEKASMSLDEVSDEVRRTRVWLQSEQKTHLARDMAKVLKEIENLEFELYSARLAKATERVSGIQMTLRKKKEQVRELEEKQRAVAAWERNFDATVLVAARKIEALRSILSIEMNNAQLFLKQAAAALHDYTSPGSPPGPGGGPSA